MSPALARVLYTIAWWLSLPLAAIYLVWRGSRQREYFAHWGERFFGHGPTMSAGAEPVIWVHAVSVGETRAAQPLIEALARDHPQARFVLTHMTPTGRAVGAAIAAAAPGRVIQRYLPYDLPSAVRRFLREVHPDIGVMLETEIWPNLMFGARAAGFPVVLVNARLSQKSAARAQHFAPLVRAAAACLAHIAAQSAADRQRLAQIYAGPIEVFGNLKFDLALSLELIEQGRAARRAWGERPVWLFASTREGEERAILDALHARAAHRRARAGTGGAAPDAAPLLLFVPRHPQRFDEVARLLTQRGFNVVRRTSPGWNARAGADTALLGDSMGEMTMYFAAADLVLMGGSLLPFGSHSLIEPCAVGAPVVLGPSTFNFAQASADAIAAGAAVQAANAEAALSEMQRLTQAPRERAAMAEAALAFAQAHRGATRRTAAMIGDLLRARARAAR